MYLPADMFDLEVFAFPHLQLGNWLQTSSQSSHIDIEASVFSHKAALKAVWHRESENAKRVPGIVAIALLRSLLGCAKHCYTPTGLLAYKVCNTWDFCQRFHPLRSTA